MIGFRIDRWQAWAPGLETAADWARWSHAPALAATDDVQPSVDFLPALQRRRLSRLARMAFHVAWPLAEAQPPMPLVFVSRHGETPRTFALLGELARQSPLSPTRFSLSVHNAIIGLWSILRGDTSEMTALAGEADGFEHALLEACALLADGAPAVLLVAAEEPPPPAYAPWVDDVPFAHAVALRLSAGDDWQLACASTDAASTDLPHDGVLQNGLPHALRFLAALLRGDRSYHTHWKTRRWTWQRHR